MVKYSTTKSNNVDNPGVDATFTFQPFFAYVMGEMPEIESEEAASYKRIVVAGVFGGTRPGGVHATLYSERPNSLKVLATHPPNPSRVLLRRIIECELIIDPLQMKTVYNWLGKQIDEYEKLYGNIPSPEEVESRSRRMSK